MSPPIAIAPGQFSVTGAELRSSSVIRVTFSEAPMAVSSTGGNDGLNPDNWTLVGSRVILAVSVSTVTGDDLSLDVLLMAPPTAGSWALTASTNIENTDTDPLVAPNVISLIITETVPISQANAGAANYTEEEIIRRHLPPTFVGPGWDSVIAALAAGDSVGRENNLKAYDQLFLSTASGSYLRRLAGDKGVRDPVNVGMSDEVFRQYALKLSNKKLTQQAILEMLEIFYGADSVKAHLTAGIEEPFALVDGSDLNIVTDEGDLVEVVFNRQDFNQIGEATAYEVAAVISRAFFDAGVGGHAVAVLDPETGLNAVKIYSHTLGLMSAITVIGGTAQANLQFPELLDLGITAGTTWAVTIPEVEVAKYALTGETEPRLLSLEVGDYVVVTGSVFTALNQGTFYVTDVSVTWNGSTYTQYFTVDNKDVVAQAGPLTLLADEDILFFSPQRSSVLDAGARSVQLVSTGTGFNITIPATTEVVSRDDSIAAYVSVNDAVDATAIQQTDGTLLFTSDSAHGLSEGDQFQVMGARAVSEIPATVAGAAGTSGNPGLSAASQITLWTGIRGFDDIATDIIGHTITYLDDESAVLIGGYADDEFKNAVSIIEIAADVPLTSTSSAARGRSKYIYNYTADTVKPTPTALHSATHLRGAGGKRVLVVGGAGASGAVNAAHIYDANDHTWTSIGTNAFAARWGHTATSLLGASGEDIVALAGGYDAVASDVLSKYTADVISNNGTSIGARYFHSACATTDSIALICGGININVDDVLDSAVEYNSLTNTVSPAGRLAYARSHFGLVKLADNIVMAIGGRGRDLSRETGNRLLSECEIYDSRLGRWHPVPNLPEARKSPICFAMNGQVYVTGGIDAAGGAIESTVRFDIKLNKWFRGVANGVAGGPFVVLNNIVVTHGDVFFQLSESGGPGPLEDNFEPGNGWS